MRVERLRTIVVEEVAEATFVDIRSDGRTPGDVFVFQGNALTDNFSTGERGVANGRCVVQPDDTVEENVYCQIELAFPEGSIFAQGRFPEMTIQGGTGCYESLQGLVLAGDGATVTPYTFIIAESNNGCSPSNPLFQTPWNETGSGKFVDWDNEVSPLVFTTVDLFLFADRLLTQLTQFFFFPLPFRVHPSVISGSGTITTSIIPQRIC